MTTTTIDCDSCPVRGRHCGDCFVPVLGRLWLETPVRRRDERPGAAPDHEEEHLEEEPCQDGPFQDGPFQGGPLEDEPFGGLRLDSDELAAVSAFVRAGLVHPEEAARARAQTTHSRRVVAG